MKSDAQIRKDVIEEIRNDSQLADIALQIGISVTNEVVTVSGTMELHSEKIAAEKAAKRVKDVKGVAMEVEVKSAGPAEMSTDANTLGATRFALALYNAVHDRKSKAKKVEEGWNCLDREVGIEYDRSATEWSVEHLHGLRRGINSVRVKEMTATYIKKKIKAVFRRNATVDSARIQVTTTDGVVKLRGRVRSWTERKDAEDAAWSMPGVKEVDNKLEVGKETDTGE